jgi:EF hand
MRCTTCLAILVLCLGLAATLTAQDRSRDTPRPSRDREGPSPAAIEEIVKRLMAFDKNGDGQLTRDEMTDARLLRLFEQADTDKDGIVTKEELTALAKKMLSEERPVGRGSAPAAPGTVLPPFVQDRLRLSDEQKKQLEALQKDVDDRLAKILTDEQKKQLEEIRTRGPFAPGVPGRRPAGPARDGAGRETPRDDGRRETPRDGTPRDGSRREAPRDGEPRSPEPRE